MPITGAEDVLDELFGAGMRPLPPQGGPPRPADDPALARVLDGGARAGDRGGDEPGQRRDARRRRAEVRGLALGRLEADGHVGAAARLGGVGACASDGWPAAGSGAFLDPEDPMPDD